VSEDLFGRGLCLSSGTQMTEEDLERVVKKSRNATKVNSSLLRRSRPRRSLPPARKPETLTEIATNPALPFRNGYRIRDQDDQE
jgi:hypothetical protein